ncbi:MAG: hypothetical protein ACYS80_02395 [Planctomycetota bacterium]
MNQRILVFTTCVLGIFFAGCGQSCFYQAGKSIEQCESDLLECIYSSRSTGLCMKARGYQYLDANKLPHNSKRKKVIIHLGSGKHKVTSVEYWIADGFGEAWIDRKVLYEQKTQEKALPRKIKGYRIETDAAGQVIKDAAGNFVKIPVYEDE